nr:MAG TPA: hypothetical protein [Caudoviricetes sp.]
MRILFCCSTIFVYICKPIVKDNILWPYNSVG